MWWCWNSHCYDSKKTSHSVTLQHTPSQPFPQYYSLSVVATFSATVIPSLSAICCCSMFHQNYLDQRLSINHDQSAICSIAALQKINYNVTCPRIFSSFLLLLSLDAHNRVDDYSGTLGDVRKTEKQQKVLKLLH